MPVYTYSIYLLELYAIYIFAVYQNDKKYILLVFTSLRYTNNTNKGCKMYIVDLSRNKLQIDLYDNETIQNDLDFFGFTEVQELQDAEWRIFETEKKAQKFINDFEKTKKNLNNDKICKSRSIPCLLYKRKYMIMSLMKLKMSTQRHYFKDFKPGQLINLHDQTFFLTVKIKKVEKLADNNYQYDFELP